MLGTPAWTCPFWSSASIASWNGWATGFLPGGSSGDAGEKDGKILYLDTTLTETLASVPLLGLGVVTLAPTGFDAGSPAIPKVEATLYCEEVQLSRP